MLEEIGGIARVHNLRLNDHEGQLLQHHDQLQQHDRLTCQSASKIEDLDVCLKEVKHQEVLAPTNLEFSLSQSNPVSPAAGSAAGEGCFKSRPQMLPEDKNSLRVHSEGWEQINKQLRTGDTSASTQNDVDGIVRALDKLPPFEGIVHSGADFGTEFINSLRMDGATFSDRAFLSTTKNLLHALNKFNRNNCWFTIQSKTGKDISKYASGETEVLFRPATRFRVTSVKDDPINNRFRISMEEIV